MQIFFDFLKQKGLSKDSLKNYKSDLNHFASWIIMRVRSFGSVVESLEDAIPFLSDATAKDYRDYLSENNTPLKTINRRLSTLRHFSGFLHLNGLCDFNFMNGVANKSKQNTSKDDNASKLIIDEFRTYLKSQNVSDSTLKNYISDVHQFISWVEQNPKHAQSTT